METDEKKSAIQRAIEYGIDITLIESNMRLTPTQRLEKLQGMMELIEEMKKVRTRRYGNLIVSDQHSEYSPNANK
ncbi:MAG: hypothetical protein KGZ58_09715 [Ignavibacteriales bacterium]|nr:hypothetical protein [Ignavibacteriales bacterium]